MSSRPLLLGGLLAAGCGLLSCTETYTLDFDDINLEPPDDLPQRLQAYRAGTEKWHGDPRAVADLAIRLKIRNLPWIAEPYRATTYTIQQTEEWGTFVTRGYVYPSGHLARYRVKVRSYQEIWYAVQVSHYKKHYLDDDPIHPLER